MYSDYYRINRRRPCRYYDWYYDYPYYPPYYFPYYYGGYNRDYL